MCHDKQILLGVQHSTEQKNANIKKSGGELSAEIKNCEINKLKINFRVYLESRN